MNESFPLRPLVPVRGNREERAIAPRYKPLPGSEHSNSREQCSRSETLAQTAATFRRQ